MTYGNQDSSIDELNSQAALAKSINKQNDQTKDETPNGESNPQIIENNYSIYNEFTK